MSTDRIEVFVHPKGSPVADGSQGYPADSLHTAVTLVRQRREPGQRAVIWVAAGRYRMTRTLHLGPEDSFTAVVGLDPSREPIFDGAYRLHGWREVQVNGKRMWACRSPVQQARSLFVDGTRVSRPSFPRQGKLQVECQDGLDPHGDPVGIMFAGSRSFTYRDGDIPELADPTAVEVVIPHYWVQERSPIAAIDRERRVLTARYRSMFALRDDEADRWAFYWLDNVAEELGAVPGEWYLDRSGRLCGADGDHILYVPREEDRLADFVADLPVLDRFVDIQGNLAAGRPVREARFEGIRFVHADLAELTGAIPPFGVREDPMLDPVPHASEIQAASTVPGAIALHGARSCALIGGGVSRVAGYAVEVGPGSRGNLISGGRYEDLGAGAVRCGGSVDPASMEFCTANEVSDNEICSGGRAYPGCVAILFQHGSHNVIAHNHIRDFYYSGISVGWMWDYHDSPSLGNRVVGNHIHDLGHGLLNDMGGIYLLGVAPGTELRNNHIHDVTCANYGGWGIYLDEGSSHVLIEGNVVHDVSSNCLHLHYGRENVVRDNIFAFGGQGQISITRPEAHTALTAVGNILLGNGTPAWGGGPGHRDVRTYQVVSAANLVWDLAPNAGGILAANGPELAPGERPIAFGDPCDDAWTALGNDVTSVVADPEFCSVEKRDLRVGPQSPARSLGIRVPDLAGVGPRPPMARMHPLAAPTLPDPMPPTRARSVFPGSKE